MTTLTIKRNGNPKMTTLIINIYTWGVNLEFHFGRGEGEGQGMLDYYKTQPHLELDLGLKKKNQTYSIPDYYAPIPILIGAGQGSVTWKTHKFAIPMSEKKSWISIITQIHSIELYVYAIGTIMSCLNPLMMWKSIYFFMGLITGLPNR